MNSNQGGPPYPVIEISSGEEDNNAPPANANNNWGRTNHDFRVLEEEMLLDLSDVSDDSDVDMEQPDEGTIQAATQRERLMRRARLAVDEDDPYNSFRRSYNPPLPATPTAATFTMPAVGLGLGSSSSSSRAFAIPSASAAALGNSIPTRPTRPVVIPRRRRTRIPPPSVSGTVNFAPTYPAPPPFVPFSAQASFAPLPSFVPPAGPPSQFITPTLHYPFTFGTLNPILPTLPPNPVITTASSARPRSSSSSLGSSSTNRATRASSSRTAHLVPTVPSSSSSSTARSSVRASSLSYAAVPSHPLTLRSSPRTDSRTLTTAAGASTTSTTAPARGRRPAVTFATAAPSSHSNIFGSTRGRVGAVAAELETNIRERIELSRRSGEESRRRGEEIRRRNEEARRRSEDALRRSETRRIERREMMEGLFQPQDEVAFEAGFMATVDEFMFFRMGLRPPPPPPPPTNRNNNDIREADELNDGGLVDMSCQVCLDKQRSRLFLPCRHLSCCRQCWEIIKAKDGACPICRGKSSQLRGSSCERNFYS